MRKDEYPFKINKFSPLEWSFICKIAFILAVLLVVDWFLGLAFPYDTLEPSYLATIMPENEILQTIFPLIIVIVVLLLTPLLNDKLSTTPIFGAIFILVSLFLGSIQYTIIGTVSEMILTFTCSVVIVLVCLNIVLLENDEPIDLVFLIIIGLELVIANLIVDIFVYGWRLNETWSLIYILVVIGGMILIQHNQFLIGALPILAFAILNDYIFPGFFQISAAGFDAGAEILKFVSILLVVRCFMTK